ncbi:hypothetical protein WMY93_022786 [Mugilogobius chulae]|uniref:Uncharacterized protein n=1 Tax=Mugilogobius chulae TaxID=88201 RepID=A0AAW0NDQ1_9GOBI
MSRQAANEQSRDKHTTMSKNWEDYTLEDDESLYSEEFDLMKVLGLQTQEVEQTSGGFVTQHVHQASDTRPKDQDQHMALVPSTPPVTSDASEAQTREEILLKELMELRTLRNREREEFSGLILIHQTKAKDLQRELDQVKEENSRLTHLSVHQHQDEKVKLMRQMKEMIVAQRNELEKRTAATQTVQRELDQAKDKNKQLKCDLSDQNQKHQEEKFKFLNQTKQLIEAHKAERDKQNRYVQELQSNLDCVTEENTALLQESERLNSQLKSQGVAIESLSKQLTEAENESLQKSENWDHAKQTLLKEKEEVQSKLVRTESQTNLLLKKMTQIQLGMNDLKIEMSEVMKTSDELKDKLQDQTQQKVLMEEQIKHRDQLVQQLKDQLHQAEGERHLLEEQIDNRDQLVQQLKDQLHQAEGERHLLEEQNCAEEFTRTRAAQSGGTTPPLEEQIDNRDQLIQKLKDQIHQSERERHLLEEQDCALEQQLKKGEEQRHLLEEQSCAQKKELMRTENQRHLLEVQRSSLEQELHRAEEQLHLLEKKNLTQDQELGRAENQHHLLKEQNSALEQKLGRAEEQRHLLEEQKSALEQELHRAEEQLHLLEKKNLTQDQELGRAEEQRHLLEEQKSALEQELHRAEKQHHLLEEQKSAQEQELHRAEEQLHLLEKKNLTQDQELGRAEEQRHQLEKMCGVLEQRLEQKQRKWYRRLLCC